MPQNLRQASNRAASNNMSVLDAFGASKSGFETDTSFSAIEKSIGSFIERVHTNIEAQGMVVTGKMADISVQRTETGINVYANPWLIYQDKGVNGSNNKPYNTPFAFTTKKPPAQVFIDWIETKNIQLRNNTRYAGRGSDFKGADVKKAAYAMREDTFRNGIAPTNVYTKEIDQLANEVAESIADVAIKTIFNSL